MTDEHKVEKCQILYKDEDLILINKPSGLLSIADGYDPALPHIKPMLEADYGQVWIVHRLDKDTSGVMILARNADAHRNLNEQFRTRKIEKLYHGLVTPRPDWREMDIQFPLQPNSDRQHRTRVNPAHGKPAHSDCRVEKWFPCGVLMEIQIHTGISHQIRAHLRAFDLALLGDQLYCAGLQPQPLPAPRTMLHAHRVGFLHPSTDAWMTVSAPYPEDFRAAYTQLRWTKAPHAAT